MRQQIVLMIFKIILLMCVFLEWSCQEQNLDYFKKEIEINDSIICKLTYEKGVLTCLEHFHKKNRKKFFGHSYLFTDSGDLAQHVEVMGDTILKSTSYFPDGRIESISYDYDLAPNDSKNIFHGNLKMYYPNGKLQLLSNWHKGKLLREAIEFDSFGNILEGTHLDSNGL